MKKAFNFKKELSFEENASSITSISLDTTFNEEKRECRRCLFNWGKL